MRSKSFACVILCVAFHSGSAQTQWKTVSSFTFDWNGRSGVRATLEIPVVRRQPGDFTRIRIQVPGEKQFVLKKDDGWVKFRSEVASTSAQTHKYRNRLRSDYVLAMDMAGDRMALLLVGYSYASSPGSLDVIELPSAGIPHVVLHRKELGVWEVRDLNDDGKEELVTYPCLSQEFGNGLQTYDPLNVYELGPMPGDPAQISVSLSKEYNQAHYYGWAGINCSEKYAVVLHPPSSKKPIVMSTEAARKMTEK